MNKKIKICDICGKQLTASEILSHDSRGFCYMCADALAKSNYINILVDGHTGKQLECEVIYA